MAEPRVSVVMPVFNGERYLRPAIESILAQTLGDFELLLIDDGSTDGSADVMRSYTDRRIRCLHNERNLGLAAVRNRGIDEAKGEYVAWLDCDDVSYPTRLEKQVEALARTERLALCGTWVRTTGSDRVQEWRYPTDPEVLRCRLIFDGPLANSSIMMRRRYLVEHDLRFDLRFPPAEDYDLWERISRLYPMCNLAEVLTVYRLHANQTSALKAAQHRIAIWWVQERMLQTLGLRADAAEKAIHLAIGVDWNFDGSRQGVLAAQSWLEKLWVANEAAKAFPQRAFSSVLAERWLGVCQAATRHGMFAWSTFWRSPLSAFAPLPLRARHRFLVKSVLRFSRRAVV